MSDEAKTKTEARAERLRRLRVAYETGTMHPSSRELIECPKNHPKVTLAEAIDILEYFGGL